MTRLRIAAVVPAYQRPHIVLEALDSIAAQTRPPDCLVVVDDGSDNETPNNIQAWLDRRKLPFEAKLVRQTNQGQATARNRGVSECPGCDVLAFLDDDDLWPVDYLQRVEQVMADHPNAVAASSDRLDIDLRSNDRQLRELNEIGMNTTERLLVHGPPGSCNTVFRAAAFDKVGGYDPNERIAEDYQLILRLSLLGPWRHIPGEAVTVRRGFSQATDFAPQSSRAYADRRYRLARVLDKFVHEDGGAAVVPERVWRRRVGRLWYSAARQLGADGRADEKMTCLRRALSCLPWHGRARAMLLLSRIFPTKAKLSA